jgi:shikimate dehydrogenase
MAKKTLPMIFGVLGFPAKHSLSPRMHNAAFKALKINARYRIFEVEPSRVKGFLATLAKRNISGLNVTIPYKQIVISSIQRTTPEARMIGAVNTIKVSKDQLLGYNTDGEGFLKHLKTDLGFDPAGKNIAVLGAGGASRAVCVYLCKALPKRIAIYNRDRSKTINLLHILNMNGVCTDLIAANSISDLRIEEADLLINTTSVGMGALDPSLVEARYLHPGLLVYDLIYTRKATRLMEDAMKKGCRVSNGLGMLLYQGMLSFKIWTGRTAPKKVMEKALGLS